MSRSKEIDDKKLQRFAEDTDSIMADDDSLTGC